MYRILEGAIDTSPVLLSPPLIQKSRAKTNLTTVYANADFYVLETFLNALPTQQANPQKKRFLCPKLSSVHLNQLCLSLISIPIFAGPGETLYDSFSMELCTPYHVDQLPRLSVEITPSSTPFLPAGKKTSTFKTPAAALPPMDICCTPCMNPPDRQRHSSLMDLCTPYMNGAGPLRQPMNAARLRHSSSMDLCTPYMNGAGYIETPGSGKALDTPAPVRSVRFCEEEKERAAETLRLRSYGQLFGGMKKLKLEDEVFTTARNGEDVIDQTFRTKSAEFVATLHHSKFKKWTFIAYNLNFR